MFNKFSSWYLIVLYWIMYMSFMLNTHQVYSTLCISWSFNWSYNYFYLQDMINLILQNITFGVLPPKVMNFRIFQPLSPTSDLNIIVWERVIPIVYFYTISREFNSEDNMSLAEANSPKNYCNLWPKPPWIILVSYLII